MASLIDRMKARMAGQQPTWTPRPKQQRSREIMRTTRWDKMAWKEARKTEIVDNLVEDLMDGDEDKGGQRKAFEPSPELVEGIFHSFYKANPTLAHKRTVERDLYPVLKILQEIQENPKLKELQEMTVGDAVMSTVAIDAMSEQVKEIVGRIPPPPPPPQPGGKKGKKQQGGTPDPNAPQQPGGQPGGPGCDPGGQGGGQPDPNQPPQPGGGGGQGQPDQNGQESEGDGQSDGQPDLTDTETEDFDPDGEDAENQAEHDWEQEYDELLKDLDLERMANKMLDAAEKEAGELDNLRKGIGLEDGEWQTMSPEERLKMAERLRSPEMRELSQVIGQMKRFALGVKATRIIDVPHEAYDVEYGNDLRRVLRPQYALLGNEYTKYEFYRRYTDKELLVYKMRGTEEVGRGPIVIAIDKSGSMSGSPFNWAMGVAEALRRFAAEEERDYYAMFFGNNNDRERFDFPKGTGPFEKVLDFLSCRANGGTEFDGVLTEALEKASKHFDDTGKGKADIVFITDGQAYLDEDWIKNFNAERERVGVRVYSVYIGGARDMRNEGGPVGLLEKISDGVIPVAELKPEAVQHIFERV